jgi:hypothetical protein
MDLDSRYSDASSSGEEQEVDEGETDEDNITESGMPQDRGSPLLYTRSSIAGETETMKGERDALKKEAEELREQCKDAWALKEHIDKVTEEINILLFEAELNAEMTENIMEERDDLRLETEELRAKCKESGELEEQLNIVIQKCKDITEERDALLLEDKIKAADKNAINKVRDALKLETENLLAQRKAAALMQDQLNVVRVQCDDTAKERHSFKLKCRSSEAACKDIRKVMEALKFEREKLRAQFKEYNLLKEQLTTIRVQCDNITKERDSFELRTLRSESNSKATRKNIEALKVQREELRAQYKNYVLLETQLNTVRQQCENIKKERNGFILKTQKGAESRWAIMIERDALKLEIAYLGPKNKDVHLLQKQLNAERILCDNMQKERDFYKLKAQRTAGNRKATRKDIGSTKLAVKTVRTRSYDTALQEEQLNAVRESCGNIAKEGDSLITEVQHMGIDREATEEDLDDSALQEE